LNAAAPGNGDVVEVPMWHGTKLLPPRQLASTCEGWCGSYAVPGSMGKGVYFAYTPQYSMGGYAYLTPNGSQQLVLADVLQVRSGLRQSRAHVDSATSMRS
jgi:hypothetical protein